MPRSLFITGTDTGVGKTLVSCALIHALRQQGLRVVGMKPVASGAQRTAHGLRNDDALALQAAAGVQADYALVNPYCFEPAIAPHLAARLVRARIELPVLQAAFGQLTTLANHRADYVVVEGAGGWRVPLEPQGYLSDFPEQLQMGVVLVVGLRLGCLNHAILTAEAIQRGPCRLLGWVGNRIDAEFSMAEQNVDTLRQLLAAPCLGIVPHSTQPAAQLGQLLQLAPLLG